MKAANNFRDSRRVWKFTICAAIALATLIPVWTLVVMLIIQPESMMFAEQTMTKRLFWWVLGPVLAVVTIATWRWQASGAAEIGGAKPAVISSADVNSSREMRPSEYVLEVISLGVTYDQYRQGNLWDVVAQGHPYASLQERDPKKYPWAMFDKMGLSGGRACDALINGLKFTPDYLGVPTFFAGGPYPAVAMSNTNLMGGLTGGSTSNGMAWHLLIVGQSRLSERPDRLLEDVFTFFDANPEVPYVIVSSYDDQVYRDRGRAPGTPTLIQDGYYVPERPDAAALLVLARRDRVEPLRKTVWDEPYDKGLTRKLFEYYVDLKSSVPLEPDAISRQPTIAEWLKASVAFAQREDIYPRGFSRFAEDVNPFSHRPPKDYKPTPWFPLPWNKDQFKDFDRLPTLGYLHRPVFVKMTDDKGVPLARRDARQAALQAGWQQALNTLPEADRNQSPARVITATGGNTGETIVLTDMLNQWTAQGGPQLDAGKATQWINTDARLGNTGAATWFMQMAIGVMGSYREGGASAAFNMRDPSEASIIFITPPSDEKRKKQKHPQGGDVFRHYATPAIDPSNYEQK